MNYTFEGRCTSTRSDIEVCNRQIECLNSEKSFLENKLKAFNTKTSKLASELAEKTKKEIDKLNENLVKESQKKANLEEELKNLEEKISERKDDVTLYIQEQSERMVKEVLKYIKDNKHELGNSIKTTFNIEAFRKTEEDRYGDYSIPTGEVQVTIKGEKITISEDFYFQENLYTTKRDPQYDYVSVKYTEWFCEYLKKFSSIFLKTLKEKYNLAETFELKINEPQNSFTLELV